MQHEKIIARSTACVFSLFLLILLSCKEKNKTPAKETINAIDLKRGEVVLCGPPDKQFGVVEFETSCSQKIKKDFILKHHNLKNVNGVYL